MHRRTLLASALAAAAAFSLTACNDDDGKPAAAVSGGTTAKPIVTLDSPIEKPDLVLTDTSGKKYDLLERTKGHPTLIYFGYTNCPDVCPLTMANIAVAVKQLPAAERKDLRVVFVTSDPERDTPAALKKWLGGIDKDFTGLTGKFDTIQAGARSVNIGIEKPVKKKNGDVVSTHGAQVLLSSPKDDRIHWMGMQEATSDNYTKALPKIVKGQNP
ncbi:SCO family protein [Streptomyces angustmyceticus]|uniref:SCO family protein n=1 Tax=Streptomyces angustmyceticus TaxID=285578 RepID=A0A5J4LGP5_9ACTN|nr:SCO family protein [Streptomyces angustmyceticus]UAL68047.1 SCO family protein [Streptomyces angustmyceticus]GES30779.1 SCO family protein [Streptomyces angustmyceticus]